MHLSKEQEQLEIENGDLLASIGNVDPLVARRVLRKHKGDMEKAADAILAGDTGMDPWESKHRTTPEPMYQDGIDPTTLSIPSTITPLPISSSVIDLTADDDDMTRAIQMSMEDSSSQGVQKFGPTERAPHPEWQMVRSNAPAPAAQDDHTLNEAIQASLKDFNEDTDVHPFKESVREGGRPIALRPEVPSLAYAALVLQALYFVPQVRFTVSNLRLPNIDPHTPPGHPDRAMWNLIELFANMDLAQLSAIVDIELLPSLDVTEYDERHGTVAEASAGVIKNIGHLIEEHMRAQLTDNEEFDRLFSFTHGRVVLYSRLPRKITRNPDPGSVVMVDIGGDNPGVDLISSISYNLNKHYATNSTHDVIYTPSEVVAFQLVRSPNQHNHSKPSPDPFVYPKSMFFDRFLFHNLELANEKRNLERKMLAEIEELLTYKATLTHFNNRDTLQDLRSTIHYYEHVADVGADPERQGVVQRTASHLKDIMTVILGKVEDIDHRIGQLQADIGTVYDCPELQRYQYDLRAVLVHTGLPGRKQIYSYVQDVEGVWWKTIDHEVTEVPEETVLTDPTGLHLGAGPYLLFYSRHLEDHQLHEPLVWPTIFSESVAENNKKFLAMMHPELGIFATLEDPMGRLSPPRERVGHTVSRENSRTMEVDKTD
ncbi:hypothetical protein B0H34DRAFT_721780 [Crassisporium funariophilum]|nr:hypothetical protein B0H34DRAFT_721780 [Crassisporium funariophilum]